MRLFLIRHADPLVRADQRPAEWVLSENGRARAKRLAEHINLGGAATIFSSLEPKALETAQLLGETFKLSVETATGLDEHRRTDTPLFTTEEFERQIERFFSEPAAKVFGDETAAQVLTRFTAAVQTEIRRSPNDTAIVTHGTALALFAAPHAAAAPFEFWQTLTTPCAVILRLPTLELERVVRLE